MYGQVKRVLIVDDDEGARDFVSAIMMGEGWEVLEAVNGLEAVEMAEVEHPDLIILDIMMPKMDGLEALRRLRLDFFTKDIPVIMLTAINRIEGEGAYSEESLEKRLGVRRPEGYVDKPVDPDFLRSTVFGVMG